VAVKLDIRPARRVAFTKSSPQLSHRSARRTLVAVEVVVQLTKHLAPTTTSSTPDNQAIPHSVSTFQRAIGSRGPLNGPDMKRSEPSAASVSWTTAETTARGHAKRCGGSGEETNAGRGLRTTSSP